MPRPTVRIIGAGLAGCEAAWQAARLGADVLLYEMKPQKFSPAHHYEGLAELVCSNSLRSDDVSSAAGLLKAELSALGSLILEAAYATRVPAGSALAVDREKFSDYITEKIKTNPHITLCEEEVTSLAEDDTVTVVATGPLTSEALSREIARLVGGEQLYFFDAAAPIVDAASVDTSIAFFASRYGKGDPTDYLNCPMTREEYDAFYHALITAETAELKDFDNEEQKKQKVFEACMPVEVMAVRGYDTLRFGPMKPVGLPLPSTGEEAYAAVQLRRENAEGTMYNLVGFQTHLTFGEQARVFRMIPGLQNAVFFRYGVMHRNTYLRSPGLLTSAYSMKERPHLFFAGQITGVEGYIPSTASGLVAGIEAARAALGLSAYDFSAETEIGALAHYISEWTGGDFQPMNANFGIIAPLPKKVKGGKKARNEAYAERSLSRIREACQALFGTEEGLGKKEKE